MTISQLLIAALGCVVVCGVANAQSATAPAPAPAADQSADTDATLLEEVIVTGYTKEKKKDVVGAVSTVDMTEIQDRPTGSIMQSLQGQIAGVQILTDGNPSSGATVRIRGQGISRLGFNDPLYIVDGVPLNATSGLQELDQDSIESVQILRDAASASIYGARAANGVVLITTKHGSGHMVLSFAAAETRQDFNFSLHPLNTQQRAQAWYTRSINSGENPNNALYTYTCSANPCDSTGFTAVTIGGYADSAGKRFLDPGLTQPVSDTNWLGEVIEQSRILDSSASLSNATEDSHFYSAVNFYDARGIVKKSEFKRFALTVNSDHQLFDNKLTLGEHLLFTNQLENETNFQSSFIIAQAFETQSIIPVYTVSGGWGGPAAGTTDHRQPVEILNNSANNVRRLNKFVGNLYGELQPIDGLTLRSSVGTDYGQNYYRNYFPGGTSGNILLPDSLNTSYGFNRSITISDTADYQRTFRDRHHFDALLGYENIDYVTEGFAAFGSGFASAADTYTFLNQATQNIGATGAGDSWTLRSYFSKLNYDYDGKYLASLTIRRDGSSRFGANNRWGNFPSAAVGWRLSQEPFFKVNFINDLKIRASLGSNGNQEISTSASATVFSPRYSTTSLFADFPCCQQETGTAYDLNGNNSGTLPSGFAKTATGNPNLKWETSRQLNLGVDFAMFRHRLEGSLDIYRKRTSDILTVTNPLATAGEGAQQVVNGGDVDNKGWELELSHRTEFNFKRLSAPLKIHVAANLSHSTNTIVALPANVVNSFPGNGANLTVLGRSLNSLFGYVGDGIFQSAAEVAALNQPGAYVGGLRILDVNGDGKIDASDRVFYGTSDPKYIFGVNFDVNYKDWAINMAWQGVNGGLVDNSLKHYQFTTENPGSNWATGVFNTWSPTNTGSPNPAPHDGYGTLPDTYFWESGSYIKLRNLAVSYVVPASLLSRVRMKELRVYLQGENLVIIKPRGTTLQDPETAGTSFPVPKRYTLGFRGSF
ncbi:MAG TPA: SusC/RagA family TonB-linked outer membrane protein [Steroidobacteraceae bacterium]|nr:SusC/RagA family TonB-linked outer membrane protein [Steroidobacteraceae bacterium]